MVQTLNSVAYLSNEQLIAVGKQGTILYSSNGGTSWKAAYSTTTQELSQVSGSGQKAVAISKTGAVIYTTNAGQTWQASSTSFNTTTGLPYSVKQTATTTFLTAGTKLYKSTNGGQSFSDITPTNPTPSANLKGVHLDEDGYGYVVGEQGLAYKITPAATQGTYTITKIATDSDTKKEKGTGIPTGSNLESVQFSDRLTGYITGKDAQGQGLVLKTVDGGLHWTTKESGTGTTIPQLALSGDAQQGTIISSSGAVNSLNDQSEQISSRFWYDELGRLILSQNARQFICTDCPVAQQQIGAKAYSYTLYDRIGRIVEVGEILSTSDPVTTKTRSQIKYENHQSFVENTSSYRHQVTTTKYDGTSKTYAGFTPTYLRNRVAYTTYQQTPTSQIQESHYSYDVHGNVKSMLQVIRGDGEELTKRIDYEYDLVSGKVNKVTYQKDNSDQFIHQYTYDGDNRIIAVATSTDDIIYTKEATYQYYAHGPLARINYGELNVETQDFAYTIQGWIKQVQGQVFAYALGYNNTDYTSIGANPNSLPTPIATGQGLYNGNIATMSSKTQAIDAGNPWVQQYTYDQLNRIKTSTTQGNNQYATSYSYDANGNILNLTRKNNAGGDIDNLTYNYENKSSGYQRNTNRLRSVNDAVATTGQSDDIEDQQEDNYRYDATGNLIYDRSEEIEKIEWTVSGKVLKVIRSTNSTKPNLEFTYDASGNRIAKKVIQPNGDYKTTFYVRDASGNVMAVYKTSGTTNLTLEEQHIYGSSRLGIFKKDKTKKAGIKEGTVGVRALGERQYELTDHLGNVRVVLIDYYKVGMSMDDRVLSATDYYPFGMVARSRTTKNNYRYGFNGKELDRDEEGLGGGGSTYDYGFRIYNPALAKFLSVDPLTSSYSYKTSYDFAENQPISSIDLEGLQSYRTNQYPHGRGRQPWLNTANSNQVISRWKQPSNFVRIPPNTQTQNTQGQNSNSTNTNRGNNTNTGGTSAGGNNSIPKPPVITEFDPGLGTLNSPQHAQDANLLVIKVLELTGDILSFKNEKLKITVQEVKTWGMKPDNTLTTKEVSYDFFGSDVGLLYYYQQHWENKKKEMYKSQLNDLSVCKVGKPFDQLDANQQAEFYNTYSMDIIVMNHQIELTIGDSPMAQAVKQVQQGVANGTYKKVKQPVQQIPVIVPAQ